MSLTLRVTSQSDGILVIALRGSVDGQTVAEFADELDRLVTPEIHDVVIECSEVTMISSHGLGALLSMHKRLEQRGGELCLAGTQGVAARIIFMTRLDRVFRRFDDVDAAMIALAQGRSAG